MALILITGSKGQLGSEIRKLSRNFPGWKFIFTDYSELDITNSVAVRRFISVHKPGWIINCAAYNYVDKAETEHETAMKINRDGVRNLTEAIADSFCKLIHFSTDYVFDGKKSFPYTENDKPSPLSRYGASKLEGERIALKNPWSMVIRTSWLYSETGTNFVKSVLKKAKEGGELKVVNDQTGSPTWAADLASVLLTIISGVERQDIAFNGGIYHYSNHGQCTWYDFAREILRLTGISCRIDPVSTAGYPYTAVRPVYSVLDCKKMTDNYGVAIPSWETSLSKCINVMQRKKII